MNDVAAPAIWPAGGGEMAQRIRAYDWAATPLGPTGTWSTTLKAAVSLVLDSGFPAALVWGPELVTIYNDRFRPILGDKPEALGRSFADIWQEAWAEIGPLVDRAFAGEATSIEDYQLLLNRSGRPERAFFTFAYSPVRGTDGSVLGMIDTVVETTAGVLAREQVQLSEQRQAFLLRLSDALRPLTDVVAIQGEACRFVAEYLDTDRSYYVEIDDANGLAVVERDYSRGDAPSLAGSHPLAEFNAVLDLQRKGQAFACDDVLIEPRINENDRAACLKRGLRSFLTTPLIKAGALMATMSVAVNAPRTWTRAEISLLHDVAERTWEAMERAHAEAALRESEAKYRTLFDAMDQGFCIFEMILDDAGTPIDLRYLAINEGFARQTGRRPRPGQTMREIFPEAEDRWLAAYAEVARTRSPRRIVDQMAGLRRWYDVYVFPTDAPPDRMQLAALFRNITREKRAEQALRASEERLQGMVNVEGVGILLFKMGGTLIGANDYFLAMSGYPREAITERRLHWRDLTPPEYVDESEEQMRLLLMTGHSGPYEKEYLRADGSRVWMLFAGAVLPDGTFIKYCLDISDRKRAEAAVLAGEERFRTLVQNIVDYAIFTIDAERRIDSWPPGAQAVLGGTEAEMVGQMFDVTFTAEDQAAGVPAAEFTAARDNGSAPDVRWHRRRDGTRVFIDGVVRARQDPNGQFAGVLKIGQDATERHLLRQRQREEEERVRQELERRVFEATAELRALSQRLLQVQEEERRRLALELHDDFGQMLTGLGLALGSGDVDAARLAEAQQVVAELTGRIRQRSMELRPAILDSHGLLPALHLHLERYRRQTGIAVDLFQEGLEGRFAAPVEIAAYRIVQEALTNVARHAETDRVVIQLFADDVALTVSIRDHGRGFDPSATAPGSGFGGMRERAELLGGTFDLDAEAGKGVTLTAELPVGAPAFDHLTEEEA